MCYFYVCEYNWATTKLRQAKPNPQSRIKFTRDKTVIPFHHFVWKIVKVTNTYEKLGKLDLFEWKGENSMECYRKRFSFSFDLLLSNALTSYYK